MSRVLAVTGGVGGAKLALGLSHQLGPDALSFLVNTGDDFEHLGLRICPDIDTLIYTLSGEANPATGWGRSGETWQFMDALSNLGGEDWFRLGDRDLATHIQRTQLMAQGTSLGDAIRTLATRLGVRHEIQPMSDDDVRTIVTTADGDLSFQHWFVREKCGPAVAGIRFAGADTALPNARVLERLADPALEAIVVCPSNPYLSVDPILATGGMADHLKACPAPVVAVSPIVAGTAIKGPTAKMMAELGVPATATAVAEHYQQQHSGLLDGFLLDTSDAHLAPEIERMGIRTAAAPSVMVTLQDRIELAARVLDFADSLRG